MFDPVCPSTLLPLRFADKWAGMVIRCLEHGPRRFSELRVTLRSVSAQSLTTSLKNLQRDGLVERTERTGPVRHVEYALTPLGRSMLPVIAALCAWSDAHWEELLDAREAAATA
ncbi:transcriptional regulator [Jiangella anatolica]|uniref:Transcriptional regulator n=2 Tax=Jiangella anatolica TaxID=2670374 RepID=A0A2W2B2N4_9ACTN|nr:transcriptional regulator [Jiangella anatolica]